MKVSVLTPLYNTKPEHLKQMIESVLNQTFQDWQLILLSDSPENKALKKVVSLYKDKRIVYTENKKNLGITKSRNILIEMSKGQYLAVLDHDDVMVPTRLEKQVAYLDKNPFVGVVSNPVTFMGTNKIFHNCQENNLDIKKEFMRGNAMPHTSMMLRKSVLIDNNVKYEEKYSPAEDYMLGIRLMEYTMFHGIQEVLGYWRNHGNNTTYSQSDKMIDADAMIKCVAYAKYPYLIPVNMNISKHYNKKWIKLFGFIPIIKIDSNK